MVDIHNVYVPSNLFLEMCVVGMTQTTAQSTKCLVGASVPTTNSPVEKN